ncbi:MAG TPA: hypothetical protein VLA48_03115 [Nitrososphaeraceae archaeon]|nr:hypothetical protein [Nitrososphaeraceae archaeon]
MKKKYKKLDYNTEDLESLSNSDLKKVADYWLRQYLLSQQESTYYFCPIKNRSYSADNMHCCHFIDRGIMSLRYDLRNVHLISAISNTYDAQVQVEGFKSKHHKEYEEFLIEEYGFDVLDYLRERSKELKVFHKEDYIEVINKFRSNE